MVFSHPAPRDGDVRRGDYGVSAPGSRGVCGEAVSRRDERTGPSGRIVLWTQSVLSAARHLYEKAGFMLVGEEPHESFGRALVAETWELSLKSRRG